MLFLDCLISIETHFGILLVSNKNETSILVASIKKKKKKKSEWGEGRPLDFEKVLLSRNFYELQNLDFQI